MNSMPAAVVLLAEKKSTQGYRVMVSTYILSCIPVLKLFYSDQFILIIFPISISGSLPTETFTV